MPDIGSFHPQIVHFVIALLITGVVFRLASLTGKLAWTGPSATALLLAGTVAAVAAVRSGDDAHEPVENTPGTREAVQEHEKWGERTRNVFLAVTALELVGLALRKKRYHRMVLAASALLGAGGLLAVYEVAEHGGDLVYAYAGGVGIRSGSPDDVGRLLLAGLYHQARLARRQGNAAEAAALFDQMARRNPDDGGIQLLAIESLIQDRGDGTAALAALARIAVPADDQRLQGRLGMLTADAYVAAGQPDSARAVLERLIAEFPNSQRFKDRLAQLR